MEKCRELVPPMNGVWTGVGKGSTVRLRSVNQYVREGSDPEQGGDRWRVYTAGSLVCE